VRMGSHRIVNASADAQKRGYTTGADPVMVARHIETARDMYRLFPALVTGVSRAFDKELGKIAE
jgi:hypothetical protein